jgi:hypothetical protein
MTTIRVAAVGDILMWQRQIESAKVKNEQYSFDSMFQEVELFLKDTNLTIGDTC